MVQGDASYPTGGYPVPPSIFNFVGFVRQKLGGGSGVGSQIGSGVDRTVQPVVIEYGPVTSTAGQPVQARINFSTGNLQFFQSTGAEVANTTNVSTFQVLLEAIGH